MSIWISKIENGTREGVLKLAGDTWELPKLFNEFETWLMNAGQELDPSFQWVVDIGFSPREGASGGGPIISTEIMKQCVEKNIAIYLSEYDGSE